MNTTLEAVREKVIEAVPEIRGREYVYRGARGGLAISTVDAPITLADVLRAMYEFSDDSWYARYDGTFFKWEKFTEGGDGHHGVESTYITWNLALSLDEQEPEVIAFLAKILIPQDTVDNPMSL